MPSPSIKRRASMGSSSMVSFKDVHSPAQRASDAAAALKMGKIPVICEKHSDSTTPDLSRKKFLVAPTMSVGHFTELLQKRIQQEIAGPFHLFLRGEVLVAGATSLKDLYDANKDTDGFLYIHYGDQPITYTVQMGPYKSTHPLDLRMTVAQEAKLRGKLPIICERAEGSVLPEVNKRKFVVAPEMKVGHFVVLIKQRIAAEVPEPFYLFLGEQVLNANQISMLDLHNAHKDRDGFLYITYDDHTPEKAVQVGEFHLTHTLQERRQAAVEAAAMSKIPIICERRQEAELRELENKKFVVAPTMTVGTLSAVLGQRVAGEVQTQIYLFVGDSVLTAGSTAVSELYSEFKDREDGLLYITYSDVLPPNTPRTGGYKASYRHQERTLEAEKALILEKVPIICERKKGANVLALNQRKFFVSKDINVGRLEELLRGRIGQEVKTPIRVYVRGDPIVNVTESVQTLYDDYKDTDKFLYITYAEAPTA